jgi:peroxiredoxin
LEILAINVDQDQAEAERFLQQNAASFDIAFDAEGKTPERYNVMGMPSSFLVDAEGQIVSRHKGFHKNRLTEYENQLRAGLGLPPLDL